MGPRRHSLPITFLSHVTDAVLALWNASIKLPEQARKLVQMPWFLVFFFFSFSNVRNETPYVLLNSWQKSARKIQCKYVLVLVKHKAFPARPLQPIKIHSPRTDSCPWRVTWWKRVAQKFGKKLEHEPNKLAYVTNWNNEASRRLENWPLGVVP